jgi:hypothetical protein
VIIVGNGREALDLAARAARLWRCRLDRQSRLHRPVVDPPGCRRAGNPRAGGRREGHAQDRGGADADQSSLAGRQPEATPAPREHHRRHAPMSNCSGASSIAGPPFPRSQSSGANPFNGLRSLVTSARVGRARKSDHNRPRPDLFPELRGRRCLPSSSARQVQGHTRCVGRGQHRGQ